MNKSIIIILSISILLSGCSSDIESNTSSETVSQSLEDGLDTSELEGLDSEFNSNNIDSLESDLSILDDI